jgi:hypothetical protein
MERSAAFTPGFKVRIGGFLLQGFASTPRRVHPDTARFGRPTHSAGRPGPQHIRSRDRPGKT